MMTNKIVSKFTLILAFFITLTASADTRCQVSWDVRIQECKELFANRKYGKAKQKASEIMASGNKSIEQAGTALYVMSVLIMGDSINCEDKVKFLEQSLPNIKEQSQTFELLCIVNKACGLYYQLIIQDYPTAQLFFFKALDFCRKIKNNNDEIDMLCNLSNLYFMKNDTTGIRYAHEAYEKANTSKYMPGLYRASANVSNFLYNQKQFTGALQYLQEALRLALGLGYAVEMQYLYSFLGDVYASLNKHDDAEYNYKKSIVDLSETSNYDKAYARLCYASYLCRQGRCKEGINLLKETRHLCKLWNICAFDKEIALYFSQAYECLGQYNNALKEYKLFDKIKEQQLNTEKEKEFNILSLKYNVMEEKRKNTQIELELLRKNKNLITLCFIIVFIAVCAIFILYLYRKQQKQYTQIVKKYLENLENERKLKLQLKQKPQYQSSTKLHSSDNTTSIPKTNDRDNDFEKNKYANSTLSERKKEVLFNLMEKLMIEEKIYRNSMLSIDELATMLNTNRSYLSQVINECSGQSYSTYINNYRIREAIELLSDVDNIDSVKSIGYVTGFNSPSYFYTIFKEKIGVSPTVFRKNAQKLNKL